MPRGYRKPSDLPVAIPVFPLGGALLFPKAVLPLNIFEPRYLEMVDAAIRENRIIGMIQPAFDSQTSESDEADEEYPALCDVGCLGRITAFNEVGDGRMLISLQGVCRFRVIEEVPVGTPFRQCRINPFLADLVAETGADQVDRQALLKVFRDYLEANNLEADWDGITKADNGFFHSLAFTLENFREPIQIKPRNRRVTQHTCLYCHEEIVHQMLPAESEGEMLSCVHCHSSVGHAHR